MDLTLEFLKLRHLLEIQKNEGYEFLHKIKNNGS